MYTFFNVMWPNANNLKVPNFFHFTRQLSTFDNLYNTRKLRLKSETLHSIVAKVHH